MLLIRAKGLAKHWRPALRRAGAVVNPIRSHQNSRDAEKPVTMGAEPLRCHERATT